MTWQNRIICGDALEEMRRLSDDSIDLIATDPPYYKVKDEEWDRQWETAEGFLSWLRELTVEWFRLLKPNGSLYVFASPRMAARVECLIGERFNVLNQIRWLKQLHTSWRASRDTQRCYMPPWEGIIFAGHHDFLFEPLRAYLDDERKRAGITTTEIHEAWCKQRQSQGRMVGHWFGRSQWALPTATNYEWLRLQLNRNGDQYLCREYEGLRQEHEELRRPFDVAEDVPRTDVWDFSSVSPYPGKHPCEKPLALMEHIIRTSSRPGAVVLDCFAGSGTTCVAAANLGRQFVGIEKNASYTEQARERLDNWQHGLFDEMEPDYQVLSGGSNV